MILPAVLFVRYSVKRRRIVKVRFMRGRRDAFLMCGYTGLKTIRNGVIFNQYTVRRAMTEWKL
jgi:hypothetical protein